MHQSRRQDTSQNKGLLGSIAKTPARFMSPRIMLSVCMTILVLMGVMMIYSASSIVAQAQFGDAAYFLKRQIMFVGIGLVACFILARVDYHQLMGGFLKVAWVVVLVLLLLTAVRSQASHGAVRWISIVGIRFQPSEFAKLTIVITGANILQAYYVDRTLDLKQAAITAGIGIGIPLFLIVCQPDKGTTLIILSTLLVMSAIAGLSLKIVAIIFVAGLTVAILFSLKDEYSRSRIITMLNPWNDPYGNGYQIIQGFYAFGSGGILGVGTGMSRQKYSYLPEAHNDFIFAIIGEELGLKGTLFVCVLFGLIMYYGMQIARYAPDLPGTLIAAGSTFLICAQFCVNVMGILSITPMTGKPLPFLSYGGSSIIACLCMVGLILSVSMHSNLPETTHDRRRSSLSVMEGSSQPKPVTSSVFQVFEGSRRSSRPATNQSSRRTSDSGRSTRTSTSNTSTRQPRQSRQSQNTQRRSHRKHR